MSVCEFVVITNQKKVIVEFGNLNIHHMEILFINFYEVWSGSLFIEIGKRIQIHYDLWPELLSVLFNVLTLCYI